MAAQPINDESDSDTYPDVPAIPAGLRIPPPDRRAPVHHHPIAPSGKAPAVWLLGAHGRSGAGTLAHIWAPAADAEGGWPAADRYPGVVVIARTDFDGLTAAQDLVLQAKAGLIGEAILLGTALVPYAPGRLSKSLRRKAEIVASASPALWQIPWVDDLPLHPRSELATWSPADPPPPPPGRMRGPVSSAASPQPQLAALGMDIFTAARTAYAR